MKKQLLGGKREEFMTSLRKEKNEAIFQQRRTKFLERDNGAASSLVSSYENNSMPVIEFNYDDLVNGEAMMKILQGNIQ